MLRALKLMVTAGALVAALSGGMAQTASLKNGGFEAVSAGKPADWVQPDYWSGSLETAEEAREGSRAAKLVAEEGQGRHWGRMHSSVMPIMYGLNYSFSVWARGSGALKLGVINYLTKREGKPDYQSVWQEQGTALTGEWQQLRLDFAPVDVDVVRLAVMVEVEGQGAVALVDEAELAVARKAEGRLSAMPYMMLPAGGDCTVEVKWDPAEAAGPAVVIARYPNRVESAEITPQDGEGVYVFQADGPALVQLDFVSAELGASTTTYVDVVAPDLYADFRDTSETARVATPLHILFLGDSLTDFSRGYNYTDQVAFWLNENHGEVTYQNAGVGGDYITRMWDRMNGDPKVYRPAAYEKLYEPKPQQIFIMLGHNDSKLSSGSGFTQAVVSIEDYKAGFRQVVGKLRADTGAKVTLLTNTSSVYEICKKRADDLVASGKGASLFGKPEVMEQYNAALREVAAELGCEVIDVYEPTKTHPDKPSLFTADGVHMTLEGNHVVALEVFREGF